MAKTIKLIIGSTRQNRVGSVIAPWVLKKAEEQGLSVETVDLKELALPPFDAPMSPMRQPVDTPEAKQWAEMVKETDAFIFLTPEYNRSVPSSLKSAIDYLSPEWNDKQAVIVSYGYLDGGKSAVNHLRDIFGWLKVRVVEPTVSLQLAQDHFDENGSFKDIDEAMAAHDDEIASALKQLV